MNKFCHKIRDYDFKIKLVDLIKWKIIDVYRSKKYKTGLHMYGIKCVTGMYGCGKTVTMTKLAMDLREKHGNDIYITSNFGLAIQDFPFEGIELLTQQFDKPIVYFWDEVQNDFPATEKNFPRPVRQALTLNRKGNGKLIYWASQDHELVHKTIRRLTIEYLQVKTLFKRLTKVKYYHSYDYMMLFEENDINKKIKIRPFKRMSFVQSDKIRNMYNSFAWDNGEELIK